jgi:prepilin-type N-terminal cleavage/methylation domain-containing protein
MEFFMQFLKNSKGFTLVEIAIVLVIVGSLLAGGINIMSASSDTASYKESQNNLNDIKESLVTYYTQFKRLPCPDTDNDPTNAATYGVENPVGGGTCTTNWGWLPHATLGIGGGKDAWGERIKYVVSGAFTNSSNTTSANFCTTTGTTPYSRDTTKTATQIIIQDLQAAPSSVSNWVAFALVSTGKNGRQTNAGNNPTAFTNVTACNTLNALEQENCNDDSTNDSTADTDTTNDFALNFGNQVTNGTTVTFDDMVVWVGDMQLISELRKSGLCTK